MTERYLNPVKMVELLTDNGFGRIKDGGRTEYFEDEGGILKKLDLEDIKSWLIGSIEKDTEIDPMKRNEILTTTYDRSQSKLQNWLIGLTEYSEDGKSRCKRLPVLRDDKQTSYVPFSNGVIVISKDFVSLNTYDDLKEKGSVWDTKINEWSISLDNLPSVKKDEPISLQIEGCFSEFIRKSMMKGGRNNSDPKYISSLNSVETSLGYLIHRYNNPQIMKNIVFVDPELSTDGSSARGGNGKSLTLKGLRHVRNVQIQDGRMFRGSSCSGSRFNFSLVTRDTDIIVIDDINPKFDPSQIFSATTEDMTIEGKGTNKIIIPFELKPKISITSNYFLNGSGHSFERRRHVVEFGNYWSKNSKTIEEDVGKLLFDDFTTDDWNEFYHFIFLCTQRWLQVGLKSMDLSHIENRKLIIDVEGTKGDGRVVDWINDHLNNRRKGRYNTGEGISLDEFYGEFIQDFSGDNHLLKTWSRKDLQKGLFKIVQENRRLEYNPQKSSRGDSMSDRRFLYGSKGNQKEHIVVGDVRF